MSEKQPKTLLGLMRLVPPKREGLLGESVMVQQGADYFIVELSPFEYEELNRKIKEVVTFIESLGLLRGTLENL